MKKPKPSDDYPPEETERRATDALRRALTTPYKPQREMIGKVGRQSSRKRKTKKIPAKR